MIGIPAIQLGKAIEHQDKGNSDFTCVLACEV
jgi:hypothetical protein